MRYGLYPFAQVCLYESMYSSWVGEFHEGRWVMAVCRTGRQQGKSQRTDEKASSRAVQTFSAA